MKITPLTSFLVLSPLALALAACATSPSSAVSSAAAPATPIVPAAMAKSVTPTPATPTVTAVSAPVAADTIDFDKQVKPFFEKYCYSCHDVEGKAAGIGFDNKSDILKTVTPGNADESRLYDVLASRQMPQGRTKPTAAEIAIIKQWINEGAKISASIPAES